jgi:hypothetical protein
MHRQALKSLQTIIEEKDKENIELVQENEEIKGKLQESIDHARTFELRKGTILTSLVKVKC